MRPPKKLLALMLTLGIANAASAGYTSFVSVGVDQAAKLIIGNTVVFDPHPKTRYDVSRHYYPSLDSVYECSRSQCDTHGVQIVDGQICEPDLRGKCIGDPGHWSFAKGDLERKRKGARIGSFVVIPPHGRLEIHAILKGNVTGYPDFTVPPGPLKPVTVDAKYALPGTEDNRGQSAGHDLGKLFPGNTLVDTDGTIEPCLKGAEYYAAGGRLVSLGCSQENDRRDRVQYSIWLLRWRMQGGRFCTTSRMEPNRYVCLTGSGQNDAVISKRGPYPPPPGRLAVQIPSSENASLLRGNIFHFKY